MSMALFALAGVAAGWSVAISLAELSFHRISREEA
jgi:hypothetical protein